MPPCLCITQSILGMSLSRSETRKHSNLYLSWDLKSQKAPVVPLLLLGIMGKQLNSARNFEGFFFHHDGSSVPEMCALLAFVSSLSCLEKVGEVPPGERGTRKYDCGLVLSKNSEFNSISFLVPTPRWNQGLHSS